MCEVLCPEPTMMPERMGIIGKTQGVSESSRPKPKKLATTTQKLASLSSCAIWPLSSPLPAVTEVSGAAAGVLAGSGKVRLTVCTCGG